MDWQTTVAEKDVALLLAHRQLKKEEIHHVMLLKMAYVLAEEADTETIQEVDDHLSTCKSCREALLMLRTTEEDTTREPLSNAEESNKPKKTESSFSQRLRFAIPIAAAALFIGAVSLFVLTVNHTQTSERPQFTTKGREDSITVAVRRGNRLMNAQHLDTLEEGDHLGFFYSANKDGYLALFTRDINGDVYVVYPADSNGSGRIEAGIDVSLPDGATVEGITECEWIIGVFSDRVLSLENLKQEIKKAEQIEASCGLSLDIPYARGQYILSFVR